MNQRPSLIHHSSFIVHHSSFGQGECRGRPRPLPFFGLSCRCHRSSLDAPVRDHLRPRLHPPPAGMDGRRGDGLAPREPVRRKNLLFLRGGRRRPAARRGDRPGAADESGRPAARRGHDPRGGNAAGDGHGARGVPAAAAAPAAGVPGGGRGRRPPRRGGRGIVYRRDPPTRRPGRARRPVPADRRPHGRREAALAVAVLPQALPVAGLQPGGGAVGGLPVERLRGHAAPRGDPRVLLPAGAEPGGEREQPVGEPGAAASCTAGRRRGGRC